MQIDMHGIDAQITWAHAPDNGVEIGPVAIKIATGFMQRIGNLDNVALKKPACIGIGQHNGGNIIAQLFFESKASLDLFIATMRDLVRGAKEGDTARFKNAPELAPRRRLDETLAARNPVLRWQSPEAKQAAE